MRRIFLSVLFALIPGAVMAEPHKLPPHAFNDCHAHIIDGPEIYWPPRPGNHCDYDDAPSFKEAAKNAGLGSRYCVDMFPELPPDSDMGAMFCNGYFAAPPSSSRSHDGTREGTK